MEFEAAVSTSEELGVSPYLFEPEADGNESCAINEELEVEEEGASIWEMIMIEQAAVCVVNVNPAP